MAVAETCLVRVSFQALVLHFEEEKTIAASKAELNFDIID